MQLNFLEAIGALTLIFGGLYLLLRRTDEKEKEIKYYIWLLNNDYEAREEFSRRYGKVLDSTDPTCKKDLREFFTEEKLSEVQNRIEEKEGTP